MADASTPQARERGETDLGYLPLPFELTDRHKWPSSPRTRAHELAGYQPKFPG